MDPKAPIDSADSARVAAVPNARRAGCRLSCSACPAIPQGLAVFSIRFRLGRQTTGAARRATAEPLPYPELVEQDAPGRAVLVVTDPAGGEIGEAQADEGDPRRLVGDLTVDVCPYSGGGLRAADLKLVSLVHLTVDAGMAEEGAACGVGGVGRAEVGAPEEQVEEVGRRGVVGAPGADRGLDLAAAVVDVPAESGHRGNPQCRAVAQVAQDADEVGPERPIGFPLVYPHDHAHPFGMRGGHQAPGAAEVRADPGATGTGVDRVRAVRSVPGQARRDDLAGGPRGAGAAQDRD